MEDGIKEEIIILLNEARNKITKAIMIYNKFEKDDVYLRTIKELLGNEIVDLVKENK